MWKETREYMAVSIRNLTIGFITLFLAALFLILLMVYSVTGLGAVTEQRIADCQQRIDTYRAELSGTDDADEIKSLNSKIQTYEDRLNILQNKDRLYIVGMAMVFGFIICAMIYTQIFRAAITTPIAAIALLVGIGISYQYVFYLDKTMIISLAIAMVMGILAYVVWRRINSVGNILFYILVALVFLLFGLNFIFGRTANGAMLWINIGGFSVQPGEFVKVLLVVIGALAYKNKVRSIVYAATALLSCIALLLLRDLGTAAIVFVVFLFMAYWLMDLRISLTCMLVAIFAVFGAAMAMPYVRERFANVGMAMLDGGPAQQTKVLQSIIFGGLGGLGFDRSTYMVNDFSVTSDTALAGLFAIHGILMLIVVVGAYAVITALPVFNHAVYPSSNYITSQVSILLVAQVALNFLGSIDVLPFTGVVAPFISDGGSALIAFGILMGLVIAALNPSVKKFKGVGI